MKNKIIIKKPRSRKVFTAGYSKTRFFKQKYRQETINKLLVDYKFC